MHQNTFFGPEKLTAPLQTPQLDLEPLCDRQRVTLNYRNTSQLLNIVHSTWQSVGGSQHADQAVAQGSKRRKLSGKTYPRALSTTVFLVQILLFRIDKKKKIPHARFLGSKYVENAYMRLGSVPGLTRGAYSVPGNSVPGP